MIRRPVRRSGLALFFTIATIVVISIIVYGMIHFMRGEVHLTENYVDSTCALLLAEAGVEEALFTIKSRMNDPENAFYKLIAKSEEGSVDIDMSRLEGKDSAVPPLIRDGKIKTRVTWKRNPDASKELEAKGLPPDVLRSGLIVINSRGTYHRTSRQIEVKKTCNAMLVQSPFPGNSVGMIAPEHGLYLNKTHQDSFKILPFDFWDPWGFTVKGGKVFMRDGARVDLPKWLMLTDLRKDLDNPWLDMGIGWTGWNGGANFAGADSIEYQNDAVTRQYYKWMGLFHWPWWSKVNNEAYNSNTKKVQAYETSKINLYDEDVYRRLSNRMVDPEKTPSQAKYFTDVNFREAFGRNEVTYRKVVPLYGWGDWRNVPNKITRFLGNPTRAHDTSHAVEINGLTYIKGDVYIEGWMKGKGLLVVEGNVYVGGDILTMTDDDGSKSALGIIAIRDKERDTSTENPTTGKIVYKPHHDSDWSRLGVTHPFVNVSPRWEGCFHAAGGFELDTESKMQKMINLHVVGNLSTDYFDRRKMPNDIKVTYYNWQEILSQSSYDYMVDKPVRYGTKYNMAVMKELIGWKEVEATL
ncbi:MAG TPA: hypothetical protein PLU72_04035 [Candidatus Ozemobacteraceae bacterium]|nr:hypothetical protein [Candidatus Ozemobacteraceae bacterium]